MDNTHNEYSSSPYYLHKSENPGSILITTPFFRSGNYNSWSRAILITLDVKNKTWFLDGSIPQPPPNDLFFPSWKWCNSMVNEWLLNTISKEFSNNMLYFQSAVEIWKDLRSWFLENDASESLKSTLHRDAMDINTYYIKIKVLRTNSMIMKTPLSVHVQLYRFGFLDNNMGLFCNSWWVLNDSYSQVRGHVLLMEPFPPLSKVFPMVLKEKRQ